MKWRVVLAVLFVLLLFAGFADLYINAFVRKRQFAIILFVVNGLDLNTLNLARQQTGRSTELGDPDDPAIGAARRRAAYRSERLYLDSFWNVALLNVQEPGQPVPDEGADATAIACGRRVENGYVATNHAGATLTSLIYAAEKARRATGLVTTSALVEATPVAFYSSIRGRPDPDRNASDLIYSKIDVILGGGEQYFTPASAANAQGRADHEDLLKDAKDQGYTVLRTRDQLNHFYTWMTPRLLGLFADDEFNFASLQPESRRQPSLAEMTRVAVSGLNKNINGYFLVVEHGLVARAAGQNGGTLTANEVGEVDEAIQTAVAYAGPDALVLVTNNYSLGGSGPQAAPTAEPAWLASRGQGSAQLRGFINNTDVYDIVRENF
jgi:alkaline phosphatase